MHVSRRQGFTLIELLVAVAIVGILASIAYPSYVRHVVTSNRAAAQSHMMDIAQRQAEYLLDNRQYAADLTTLGLSTPAKVSSFYDISCCAGSGSDTASPSGTPPTFVVIATPRSGSSQSSDGTLKIWSDGTKSPSDKW